MTNKDKLLTCIANGILRGLDFEEEEMEKSFEEAFDDPNFMNMMKSIEEEIRKEFVLQPKEDGILENAK
jgi:hypothetical protein